MSWTAAAPTRSLEKEVAGKDRKASAKEDRPCSLCGHLCSAHAPADYTRMYCEVAGCPCESYFPAKHHEAVVQENLALHKQIDELEARLEQLNRDSLVDAPAKGVSTKSVETSDAARA